MDTSKPSLFTCVSPALLHLYDLKNAVVVIIDVFRATSTIASALYNGAKAVIPVDTVAEAVALGKKIDCIAAGERDGKVADGLQYGNSPLMYNESFIKGKILALTTTNGTRMLQMALNNGAENIITASFVNLSAVCNYLTEKKLPVVLGCAGWKDRFNLEDTLMAGAIIKKIKEHFTIHCDSSLTAEYMYEHTKNDLYGFASNLTHYHRLVERFGLIEDIRFCLTADVANVLPIYKNGRLIKY